MIPSVSQDKTLIERNTTRKISFVNISLLNCEEAYQSLTWMDTLSSFFTGEESVPFVISFHGAFTLLYPTSRTIDYITFRPL